MADLPEHFALYQYTKMKYGNQPHIFELIASGTVTTTEQIDDLM